jgi:6-phosphogluconolactonase (cycloisomerase 2 family)
LGALGLSAASNVDSQVTPEFAYVVNHQAANVSIFSINTATGGLTASGSAPVGGAPASISVTPDQRFLYVVGGGGISGLSVNAVTGQLSPVPGSPYAGGTSGVAVSPNSKYLYVTSGGSGVAGFGIDPSTGSLTSLPGSPYTTPSSFGAQRLTVDPTGKFVYVPFQGSNSVGVYALNASTGALTSIGTAPTGAGPIQAAVDPQDRFLYVTNGSANSVSGYVIDPATGLLTPIPGSPFTVPGSFAMAIDPTGHFAYASTYSGGDEISAFTINQTSGALSPSGAPLPTVGYGYFPAFDNTGQFLYWPGYMGSTVLGYHINSTTGAFTPVPGSPFPDIDLEPVAIAVAGGQGCSSPSVYPNHGGNTGQITIQLQCAGSGIQSGSTVTLSGIGLDIVASNVTAQNSSFVSATFDLTGAIPGVRDVVITNPDGTSVRAMAAFTVDQGGAPQVSVNIIGRPQIRVGTPQTYYLAVTNSGSVDSPPGLASLNIPNNVSALPTNGTNLFVGGNTTDPTVQIPSPNASSGSSLLFATPSVPSGVTFTALVQLTLASATSATTAQLRTGPALSGSNSFTATPTFTLQAAWQQQLANLTLDQFLGLQNVPFISFPSGGCSACLSQYTAELLAYSTVASDYQAYQNAKLSVDTAFAAVVSDIGLVAGGAFLVDSLGLPTLGAVSLGALIGAAQACADNLFDDQSCLSNFKSLISVAETAARDCLAGSPNCFGGMPLPPNLVAALKSLDVYFDVAINAINGFGSTQQGIGAEKAAYGALQQDLGPYATARSMYQACLGPSTCMMPPPPPPPPTVPGSSTITINPVSSLDPNVKLGLQGAGPGGYVSGSAELAYSIFFDNQPTATAPAQSVSVTDPLSPSVDAKTLVLGPIAFPNGVVNPPTIPLSVSPFTRTVDLRPVTNLLVKVNATLNTSTGVLYWTFQSLDPATNQPPTDPLAGFLPPGAEASVTFTALPKSTVTTGTIIQNTATVVFDVNPPINTPVWVNTIDNTKPTSHVSPLPATQTTYGVSVQWSGTDVGAGIQDFTIYASDNGGPFVPWLTNTAGTQAIYSGVGGHTYRFYSIARDLVGNIENAKTAPEATTQVLVDTTPPVIVPQLSGTSGNNGWYRSSVTVTWSVGDPESGIASLTGCSPTTLTTDTAGVTLTCSATNGAGLKSSVPVTIKIDATPPVISGMPAAGCSLWPPNGKMVQVATVTAADALSRLAPGSFQVTGTSNEPPSAPEISISPNGPGGYIIQLQEDRSGTGTGRIYTLTATASDLAGNTASVTATCTVPHDQGN